MHLLTTITRPNPYRSFLFQEGFLITRWRKKGTYLIGVRKIACSVQEVDEEVVMDVGSEMV
jgi:hypothetical protein